MKKLTLAGISLLSILALTACSGASKAEKKETTKEEITTTQQVVEKTTEAASDKKELTPSTVVYLSDEEIDAIQTIGDYKTAFKSLQDSYVKDFEGLIAQLPTAAKTILEPVRDELLVTFEQQLKDLDAQTASFGDDSTPIPAEGKSMMTTALKQARDSLKQSVEAAYEQAKTLIQ